MTDVKSNLNLIKERIENASLKAGRSKDSVKLIAVSKFHPVEDMINCIESGHSVFGENRVQEAKQKYEYLKKNGYSFTLHIIGTLQRNKVKDAVRIADCIQSVDRLEVLDEIEKQCAKLEKKIDILIEVHTGEESKSGFEQGQDLDKAVRNCAESVYPHVNLKGFMTMAPDTKDESLIRASFKTLRDIKEKYSSIYSHMNLTELSMGMSGDYESAIEEGSTMVRVGTAIFGERDYSK